MAAWKRRKSGASVARLGHGLDLLVWREEIERLPEGAPKYNMSVFGQHLETRATTEGEGRHRAEAVSRSWLSEARLAL